jgi:hypothetical protein
MRGKRNLLSGFWFVFEEYKGEIKPIVRESSRGKPRLLARSADMCHLNRLFLVTSFIERFSVLDFCRLEHFVGCHLFQPWVHSVICLLDSSVWNMSPIRCHNCPKGDTIESIGESVTDCLSASQTREANHLFEGTEFLFPRHSTWVSQRFLIGLSSGDSEGQFSSPRISIDVIAKPDPCHVHEPRLSSICLNRQSIAHKSQAGGMLCCLDRQNCYRRQSCWPNRSHTNHTDSGESVSQEESRQELQ